VGTVAIDGHGLRIGGTRLALGDLLDVTFDRRVRAATASCVLVGGTVLAGRIDAIDGHAVRVTTSAVGELSMPADGVARVCFGPVGGDLLDRVPTGATGLLLRDGDFFEGTLSAFNGTAVTMSSPLLGETTFGTADRAAALVLRPTGREAGAWVVRTTDGSTLSGDGATIVGGAVRLDVAGMGPMAVRLTDVALIRAGGDRVVSLADLVPTDGTAVADATPAGLPPRLVGGPIGRSVCISGGRSVTYRLGGAYSAFACRVGVPAGVVPTEGVHWSVRLDGRVVADSGAPRTSVDDPVDVIVPTAKGQALTLVVEPGRAGAMGLFADPVVVRNLPMVPGAVPKNDG
jgi:hypothetical protein